MVNSDHYNNNNFFVQQKIKKFLCSMFIDFIELILRKTKCQILNIKEEFYCCQVACQRKSFVGWILVNIMDNKKARRKSASPAAASTGKSPAPALAIKRSDTAPVTLRGWLYKQGSDGLQLWKKRWFVLSEYCLFYYKGKIAIILFQKHRPY